MKGTIRSFTKNVYGQWKPCGPSIIPHRAYVDEEHWQWVWYEPLEWREAQWVDVHFTKYRIPGAPVE